MFINQLSDILAYIKKLNMLNTDNVKPMVCTSNRSNIFREDKLVPSISREDAFQNSPAKFDVFFKVPKVIE